MYRHRFGHTIFLCRCFVALQFNAFAVNNFEILVWQLERRKKNQFKAAHNSPAFKSIFCVYSLLRCCCFTWPFLTLHFVARYYVYIGVYVYICCALCNWWGGSFVQFSLGNQKIEVMKTFIPYSRKFNFNLFGCFRARSFPQCSCCFSAVGVLGSI